MPSQTRVLAREGANAYELADWANATLAGIEAQGGEVVAVHVLPTGERPAGDPARIAALIVYRSGAPSPRAPEWGRPT